MNFNGPGRELSGSIGDERVYCVQCGTIFVPAYGGDTRDCPSCTLNEKIESLEDKLDQLDRDMDVIDL